MTAHTPSSVEATSVPSSRRAGEVRRRGDELLSIGAVLTFLRDDFPEVTISKIRFLEAEGLVEPQRTPSGYRKFSPADLERLAYVLRVQRDHYLPLRVIREHLDAIERGEAPPALPVAEVRPGPVSYTPARGRRGRGAGARRVGGVRAGRGRTGRRVRRGGAAGRPAGRRTRAVRPGTAPPAGDEGGGRPRGLVGRPGGRTAAPPPQPADQGPCRGHRARTGDPLGPPARRDGPGGPSSQAFGLAVTAPRTGCAFISGAWVIGLRL